MNTPLTAESALELYKIAKADKRTNPHELQRLWDVVCDLAHEPKLDNFPVDYHETHK